MYILIMKPDILTTNSSVVQLMDEDLGGQNILFLDKNLLHPMLKKYHMKVN